MVSSLMLIVVERRETFHYYYPMGVHPPGDLTVTIEQSSAKLDLAVSIAKKLAQSMVTQDEFNPDYFSALVAYITLGAQGRVVLYTKTETEVTMDDGSN